MIKVGLTGGIGSGKSTVAKIFSFLGIPIFYSDLAAKYIMVNDLRVKSKIIELLGTQSYLPDGQLNRAFIAKLVFNDALLLSNLNEIVHPAVFKAGWNWFNEQSGHYAIKESALIFETKKEKKFDKIISVTAPMEIRLSRVQERDKSEQVDVKKRMSKQIPQEVKDKSADFVIFNDGSQSLIKQIWELHLSLLSKKA